MKNEYIPDNAKIVDIDELTSTTRLLTLKFLNEAKQKNFNFIPGQFLQVSLLGYGEVPVAIASSPYDRDKLQICVRKAGIVTTAIHNANEEEIVGIRGPYGNGFPLEIMKDNNLVLVAGGTGVAPMRSIIHYIIKNRKDFKDVHFLYGAKTPDDLLFRYEFKEWEKYIYLCITVDKADKDWTGDIGIVTNLCRKIEINPKSSLIIMVGPELMYNSMLEELSGLKIPANRIYASLERRMKCGIGKCQHCATGLKYVCLDGPIFNYTEILKMTR